MFQWVPLPRCCGYSFWFGHGHGYPRSLPRGLPHKPPQRPSHCWQWVGFGIWLDLQSQWKANNGALLNEYCCKDLSFTPSFKDLWKSNHILVWSYIVIYVAMYYIEWLWRLIVTVHIRITILEQNGFIHILWYFLIRSVESMVAVLTAAGVSETDIQTVCANIHYRSQNMHISEACRTELLASDWVNLLMVWTASVG